MKPKNIIILVVAILLLGVIFYLIVSTKPVDVDKADTKDTSVDKQDEIAAIQDANKQTLSNAQSVVIKDVRPIDKTDYAQGDLTALVQIIVYDDFSNSFSADFYDVRKKIVEEFGEEVVIAFRHFPLRFNQLAVPAALASECAGEQDKFWEMHDWLFTANKNQELNQERLASSAVELLLDVKQFEECVASEKYLDKIQTQVDEAKTFGISGAPASFINSEPAPGAVPWEDFTDSSNREREGMKSIIERHLEDSTGL